MSWKRLAGVLAAVTAVTIGVAGSARASDPRPVSYDFMLNAMRYGPDASAPGENIWSCRPSSLHPEPVVLVPGTFGDAADNWGTYAALLHDRGYCVYALTYGVPPQLASTPFQVGGMNSIESSAAQLAGFVTRVLDATGAQKVDLVGHSQGTLMPDYYVKFLGGAPYVDRYVSLAPLWHGEDDYSWQTEWWAITKALGFPNSGEFPFCRSCTEMVAGSAFMDRLRAGGVAVPGVTYTNIVTDHDEVVWPYSSGIEPGMTNIVVQSRCPADLTDHVEIASDPVAAAYVLNALDPAHPEPVPCVPVLPLVGPPAPVPG